MNRKADLHQIWYVASESKAQQATALRNRKFRKQDGRRRHLGFFMKSWITRELYIRFSQNFNQSFVSSHKRRFFGSKMKFCKIQDGRRPPIEIYKYGNNFWTVSPKWIKFEIWGLVSHVYKGKYYSVVIYEIFLRVKKLPPLIDLWIWWHRIRLINK